MRNENVNLRLSSSLSVSLTLFSLCLSLSIPDESYLVYLAKTHLKIVTVEVREGSCEKKSYDLIQFVQ